MDQLQELNWFLQTDGKNRKSPTCLCKSQHAVCTMHHQCVIFWMRCSAITDSKTNIPVTPCGPDLKESHYIWTYFNVLYVLQTVPPQLFSDWSDWTQVSSELATLQGFAFLIINKWPGFIFKNISFYTHSHSDTRTSDCACFWPAVFTSVTLCADVTGISFCVCRHFEWDIFA